MKILCSYSKLVPVKDLIPHPDNENKHSEDQIRVLASIIKKDGYRHPIVVSNLSGKIASGHGRREALLLLEEEFAPVDFQDFDDPIQELRVRTSDNQIARYAEFNRDQFRMNLEKLDIKLEEVNFEDFGILDFIIAPAPIDLGDDKPGDEENKQYKIEVKFSNDCDMMDLYDDLISKNYAVRIVK
jgi:hypothetical protein